MQLRRGSVSLLAVLAAGLSLSVDGLAQSAMPAPRPASSGSTVTPKYRDACALGNAKFAARDFSAAVAAYRSAIEIDPKNPLGHYLAGEAQLASGNMAESEAEWNRASMESSDRDAGLRARILFVLADLKERQKKWDDAKAAWQVYLDWAAKYPNAAVFPASAQSRQQAIDSMTKQDRAYEVVRQRIADAKGGNVFNDLSKTPQPSAAPAPPPAGR